MRILDFLSDLASKNIKLWLEGEKLRYSAPPGALTPELLAELKAHKAEIYAFLQNVNDAPPIQSAPRNQELPASFDQKRLWFIAQLNPGNVAYHSPEIVDMVGELNVSALEQSLNELVRRHESLRTRFKMTDDQVIQIITPYNPLTLPVIDFGDLPEAERENKAAELMHADGIRPFDLTTGPLFRVFLMKLDGRHHILMLNVHHIISDEWSSDVIWHELARLYEAYKQGQPSPLPELPIQYADYAVWQRNRLQGEFLEKELAHWQQQLGGQLPVLELPTDYPRPAVQTFNGTIGEIVIPLSLSDGIKKIGQEVDATPFMTLFAAFATLLYRYSGQEDILVGTSIANRGQAGLEGLIGFFVNTLVLRANLADNPTFKELLGRVREMALEAYDHQELPFEKLVERLQPDRDPSRNPLFQVMFGLETGGQSDDFVDLTVSHLDIDRGTALFDLEVLIRETAGGLVTKANYNTDLFNSETIKRMLGHFETLLAGIVANPEQQIAQLPLLTEAERQQLLVDWNATQSEYPGERVFSQLFEAQVEKTPEAIAVEFKGEQVSYREFNRRVNQLAHHLQALGVGPEEVVGVSMERSPEMLLSLLAIFKAGGAYMPLSPDLPVDRIEFMVSNSKARAVLSKQEYAAALVNCPAPAVCLDTAAAVIAQQPETNPIPGTNPQSLAYIIYTSGSTGLPKGAMVIQQGMINHLHAKIFDLNLTGADRIAETAPQSFDISIWQFLVALLVGGTVHIFDDEVTHHPAHLLTETEAAGITILEVVPSMLRFMLEEIPALQPPLSRLRWLMLTGEALPPPLCREWLSHYPAIPLINAYGPTECSDDVTHHPIPVGPSAEVLSMPIGRPVANTQLYILDKQMQPLPIGIAGELYVGGDGVGRGYLNDPERTAAAFVEDPFVPGGRLYKTGDLTRYQPDGTIDFLGRIDYQVKIRGFRIELGEIEAVLEQHPNIQENVVVVQEDTSGGKRLVAYLVQTSATSVNELRQFLKEKLPDYLIPAVFVNLEAMPLTPNGKINRHALPDPDQNGQESKETVVAPRNPTEQVVADIMAKLLKLERVSVYDDFFDVGGHSLLATQFISRINKSFRVELPLRRLFEASTVAELAATMLEEPGQRVKIEKTAQLLLKLAQMSDAEIARMLKEKSKTA